MSQIDSTTAEITNWACSALSIIVLVIRTIVSRDTPHVTTLSKWICAASIFVISARIPVAYFILQARSKDMHNDDAAGAANILSVETVAILTLTARVLATTYLWMQVALLLRFYTRIVGHIHWIQLVIRMTWIFFFLSYTIVLLATFLECRPLNIYWSKDKLACQQARAQMFTQGIFAIVLDAILFAIVVRIIYQTGLRPSQRLQVLVLVCLGTSCIVVTGMRLAYVENSKSSQVTRTFWAAIAVAISTIVANAPTIVGCFNLKRVRRTIERREADAGSYGDLEETELKLNKVISENTSARHSKISGSEHSDSNSPAKEVGLGKISLEGAMALVQGDRKKEIV